MPEYHRPVLVNETLALLDPKPGGVFVDAALGGGGHGAELQGRIGPGGLLIGIDRDPEAVRYAGERLAGGPVKIVQGDFRDLASILASVGVSRIDGALFDFGVSSRQLDTERGFTFSRDEPLSMKMDPTEETPDAADLVNRLNELELADMIYHYGEERYSRRVARAIVEARARTRITTTKQLADVIVAAVGGRYRGQDIHPATRTFQAIRIRVNRELEAIEIGLPAAIEALKPGSRVCAISFHSLEDATVKSIFRRYSGRCECGKLPECRCGAKRLVSIVTRKPVIPSDREVAENPRSRSAKLRCAERLEEGGMRDGSRCS